MRQMIEELKAIPGVVGAGIYSSVEGLQATNLPGIFKPERLNTVGKHLAKLCSVGRLSFNDLTDVTLNYDESVIVARELDKNLLLFAFCDPSFNHNLLSMSFNLLQEDFRAGNFKTETPAPASLEAGVAAAQPTALQDDALATLLAVMRERLSKILGPMAGFIFDEVADDWKTRGAADSSRITELISGLEQEIADEEKIARYQQLIAPELQALRGK
ncbi:MAG: hypothetical protein GXP51_05430 [Deltaproteobacteria bacterium]|nr:hypothetical protein [Deltaproteobacteria bacterium]